MTDADVIVVGAGPAGSVAALLLARAGVRVWLIERETMPRHKLCGDTINPGAVTLLTTLGLVGGPLETAEPLHGMLVTSPRAEVRGLYPDGRVALAVSRARFDQWLMEAAVAAGAKFECGVRVRDALWREPDGQPAVMEGVQLSRGDGKTHRVRATITIAADGRRSVLARAAGLSRHPRAPQRWAFGVYGTDVVGMSGVGEMHVRPGHYVGLAPLGGGLTNVCVVTGRRPEGRTVEDVIRNVLVADKRLHARTAGLRSAGPSQVIGPLAVDCDTPGTAGLLLAGDAAGFIDPMTGDGVHIAIRGGMLAAAVALEALESGNLGGAAAALATSRARALGPKLRFNRWLRRLVGSAAAMEVSGLGARMAPTLLERVICYAGDAA